MPLPVLSKTYAFDVNNIVVASGVPLTDRRTAMKDIKDALKTLGSNPWVVDHSCNSVTAGAAGDGNDRWSAITDLVWNNAGSAHSWIVLKQTGISANFQICIDLNSSVTSHPISITVSPSSGFSGGTTTNRPTAADEISISSARNWAVSAAGSIQFVWHLIVSSDGQVTRLVLCSSNAAHNIIVFEKAANPVTGWANPWFAYHANANSGVECLNASSATDLNPGFIIGYGASSMLMGYTVESGFDGVLSNQLTTANDLSGEWPLFPLGLACTVTVGSRGRHGSVFDLWLGSTTPPTGDCYPGDSSRQFAHFGDLVFPWNGTNPVIA
jgi:hypothetical protein